MPATKKAKKAKSKAKKEGAKKTAKAKLLKKPLIKSKEEEKAEKSMVRAEEKATKPSVKTEEKKPVTEVKLSTEEIAKRSQISGKVALYEVLEYPLISEKSMGLIEKENKVCFIVNKKARKTDVKKAVETLYNVKVDKVNVIRDMKSRKKAFVKINKEFKAEELATKLGVI